MKDGWKENEIKGTSKGKKKKDVKLPNLPQAKAHPPGQPGKPNPDPSSPWLPGKAPRLAYNKFDGTPTDEAQAIENIGLKPMVYKGLITNFKITYPEDLINMNQIFSTIIKGK